MKKLIPQLAILTIASLLASSCGNLPKISLTKRHYRSGYFVNFTRGKQMHHVPIASVGTRPTVNTIGVTKQATPIPGNNLAISAEKVNISQESKVLKKRSTTELTTSDDALALPTATFQPGIYNKDESELGHHDQVNVNVSFALIVVCAIFIPPLGVALMYGIDSYFWIDLILTLLFFFPGMIFALIVVLS